VATRIAPEEFNNVSVGVALSSARLIDARSTPVQYERTPRHVAHSGIDHYQLAMHLEGETEFTAGRRTARMRPGDVCLIDMAQETPGPAPSPAPSSSPAAKAAMVGEAILLIFLPPAATGAAVVTAASASLSTQGRRSTMRVR